MATALAVAFVVVSCSGKLKQADKINLEETPVQVVSDMFAVQTKDGVVMQRIEAKIMERYESDTLSLDKFPLGLSVFSYTADGLLESTITARRAEHRISKKGKEQESWSAFGNVIIRNVIKEETMQTDTIYWDRKSEQIWTDCYVKMFSRDGMMQGYGMRSDDRARNAILLNPFDGFAYTNRDTTVFVIDSANFIGPLPNF
ncbi:MAG: LPS export ABC transporter periplasmic protein LptC [Bacteroidales bacterium]|nr:LPS export ABC transporter periplasmic protein LptC [Candidatus Cryptobacteroides aphodequi]